MFDNISQHKALNSKSSSRTGSEELEKLGRSVDSLLDIVQNEVASWTEGKPFRENRTEHRQPYQGRIVFVPVEDLSEQPIGEPFLAVCKDISPGGLKFCHSQPISARKIALKLIDEPDGAPLLIVSLRWTRFTNKQQYHSGAKVIRNANFELDADLDFDTLRSW